MDNVRSSGKTRLDIIAMLCIWHIILQILDGTFTYWGVSTYGIEIEGNPFVSMLIEQFGLLPGLLMAKGSGIAIVTYFYNIYKKNSSETFKTFSWVLITVNLIYALVVFVWFLVWLNPNNWMIS